MIHTLHMGIHPCKMFDHRNILYQVKLYIWLLFFPLPRIYIHHTKNRKNLKGNKKKHIFNVLVFFFFNKLHLDGQLIYYTLIKFLIICQWQIATDNFGIYDCTL